jgi:ribosomal protein L35
MKAKTNKTVSKRFQIKRSKRNGTTKILKRAAGQDHFNSRERGNTTRNKRRDVTMHNTVQQTLLRAMPNS